MSAEYIKRCLLSFVMITSVFISCQNSAEEITPLNDARSFTTNSDLAMNLTRMTLLDGSSDNYFDNASCLKLLLPFTARVNQEQLEIESEDDFQSVQLIYEQNPYATDNFELVFPVTVFTSEYVEITINSEDDLEQLASQCIENGQDEDIECVDFTYPLTIATYNSSSQQIGNEVINGDRELFDFIRSTDEDNLLGFDFPLELVDSEGTAVSVNDNNELNSFISDKSIGCDEEDYTFSGSAVELQNINLKLTDAPFPFTLVKEANVTLGRIDLYTSDDNDSIPFITLSTEMQSFNLLELTNGLTVDLAETDVPVGLYDHIRIEVTESSVELEDGTLYDLKVPSGSIRLKGDETIEVLENASVELLADFDVSRSFVVQGNPNTPAGIKGFLLKPVIKLSDLSKTGTLRGVVTQNGSGQFLEGVQISVYAADTLNTTSFSDEDGQYTILGLTPGEYEINAERDGFSSSVIENVELVQKMETIQDIQLTEE